MTDPSIHDIPALERTDEQAAWLASASHLLARIARRLAPCAETGPCTVALALGAAPDDDIATFALATPESGHERAAIAAAELVLRGEGKQLVRLLDAPEALGPAWRARRVTLRQNVGRPLTMTLTLESPHFLDPLLIVRPADSDAFENLLRARAALPAAIVPTARPWRVVLHTDGSGGSHSVTVHADDTAGALALAQLHAAAEAMLSGDAPPTVRAALHCAPIDRTATA